MDAESFTVLEYFKVQIIKHQFVSEVILDTTTTTQATNCQTESKSAQVRYNKLYFIVIFLGQFCLRGNRSNEVNPTLAPISETRQDHNTGNYAPSSQ